MMFGFTGNVTFVTEAAMCAALVPLARIVLETDGPHLCPSEGIEDSRTSRAESAMNSDQGSRRSARGGRGGERSGGGGRKGRGGGDQGVCHPGHIPVIAAALARIKSIDVREVLIQCRRNSCTLYGI
jgi:Tat protein secretion system quality control protein TatD with DNase activity